MIVLCCVPAAVRAQVTVNPAALLQLAGIAPAPLPVAAPLPVVHHALHRRPPHLVPEPALAIIRPATQPAPPPAQQIVAKPAPPPPKPATLAPVVISFAPAAAGLPANAAELLKPYCAGQETAVIDAYAPADSADPSAAMRLSLSRAFALRDALLACGVPAGRIIPRADGAAGGGNTAIARLTPLGEGPKN
jgi:hypothetical protein